MKAILFLFFLISINYLPAQDYRLGFFEGLGLSNIRTPQWPAGYPQTISYNPILSTSLNAYIGFKGAGKLGAFIEPGIVIKGGLLKNDIPNGTTNVKTSLTYIQLPLSLQYSINDKFFISAGPEADLLLRARVKEGFSSHDASIYFENALELSGQMALNYSITEKIDIGFRYGRGFSIVRNVTIVDENYNPVGNVNAYNQYFHFLIRIKSDTRYSIEK